VQRDAIAPPCDLDIYEFIKPNNKKTKKTKQNCVPSVLVSAFFLGERRGTRTPKKFVNLTGESKKF
jgi:hypothetical protein